jgi:hypothetical protein
MFLVKNYQSFPRGFLEGLLSRRAAPFVDV